MNWTLCEMYWEQNLKFHYQVGDTVIGTHYIDLSTISNDGDKGTHQYQLEHQILQQNFTTARLSANLRAGVCPLVRLHQGLQLHRRALYAEWRHGGGGQLQVRHRHGRTLKWNLMMTSWNVAEVSCWSRLRPRSPRASTRRPARWRWSRRRPSTRWTMDIAICTQFGV